MRRVDIDDLLSVRERSVCSVDPNRVSVRDEEAADDHSKDGGSWRRTERLLVLVGFMQSCFIIYK